MNSANRSIQSVLATTTDNSFFLAGFLIDDSDHRVLEHDVFYINISPRSVGDVSLSVFDDIGLPVSFDVKSTALFQGVEET